MKKNILLLCIIILALLCLTSCGLFEKEDNSNSKETVYQLKTASDFDLLNKYNKASFELMADIDFKGESILGFEEFYGKLNGNGYQIYNFKLDAKNGSGIFKNIAENAIIENIKINNFTVLGNTSVLLALSNRGLIERCYISKCQIKNERVQAGLVFGNYGTIKECCVDDASLKARGNAGGICAFNLGTITNCYFKGKIETVSGNGSDLYIGGLVGENEGVINNSYSICSVEGQTLGSLYMGGLCGINISSKGSVNNCYCATNDGVTMGYSKTGFFEKKQYNNCYSANSMVEDYGSQEEVLINTLYNQDWVLQKLFWDVGKWEFDNCFNPQLR